MADSPRIDDESRPARWTVKSVRSSSTMTFARLAEEVGDLDLVEAAVRGGGRIEQGFYPQSAARIVDAFNAAREASR